LGGAETFLPDQHANQEEDQGDANHHGGRGESLMGFRCFDLVEFLEQLACVKFSVVLGPESLNGPVDALSVVPAKQFCQVVGLPARWSSPWSSFGSQWFLIRPLRSHDP